MFPLSKQDQFNVTTPNIWQKQEITPYPWFTFLLFFTLFSVRVKVAKLWKNYIQGYQVHARWCAIPVTIQNPRHIHNLRESFLFSPQNMNGLQISKGVLLFPKIYYILLSTLRMIAKNKKTIGLTRKTINMLFAQPYLTCTTTTWKCHFLYCMENVEKQRRKFYFSFWTWIWSLGIQP